MHSKISLVQVAMAINIIYHDLYACLFAVLLMQLYAKARGIPGGLKPIDGIHPNPCIYYTVIKQTNIKELHCYKFTAIVFLAA